MHPHVHTGVVAFLFAGVSAVVFINVTRMLAAKAAETSAFEPVGRWVGGLVTFGTPGK